jgi:AcrR family transcriptional regulator
MRKSRYAERVDREETGLRERKKQRTRETIARVAVELFDERGYHATTLAEIAEAADVSTRTIFAYFPSKEDILFAEFPAMKEAFAQALAERPAGKDTLETMRDFILSIPHETDELHARRERIIRGDETLRSHKRARLAQLDELLAASIAKDLDAPADDLRPHIVAASLIAAFEVLSERRGDAPPPRSAEEIAAAIDPIVTFLRGGLEALKQP